MGTGQNAMILRITELTKTEKGEQVIMHLLADMVQDGVIGDNEREGNGESMQSYSHIITIDQLTHSVRNKGKLQAEVSALVAKGDAMDIDAYDVLDDIVRSYANATQDKYNAAAREAAAAIARGNQDGGSAAAQAAPAPEPAKNQGLNQPEAPVNQA